MAKNKYYAVRKGRKIGVFTSWEECQKHIKGFSGAEYKSFGNLEDANKFLSEEFKDLYDVNEIKDDEVIAYVDGSYDNNAKIYGSGIVIISADNDVKRFKKSGDDKDLISMRNVAGEIMASEFAMKYAVENSYNKIYIYYDYEGIEKWCSGEWKTNKVGTKNYKESYDRISKNIEVVFIKVKAHSGDKYNEEADLLASEAIDDKLLNDNRLDKTIDAYLLTQLKGYKKSLNFNFFVNNKVITSEDIYVVFKKKWQLERQKLNNIKELRSIFDISCQQFIIMVTTNDGDVRNIVIMWREMYE